ncbi:hypothetical protein BaRGS_00022995 [Batillaria attramentaria]|uniref:Uncharacterized protein n=1 Tax=Batillaria attramentaria TaxID=370345 RepID=A0ABD0KEW9_9CAEN
MRRALGIPAMPVSERQRRAPYSPLHTCIHVDTICAGGTADRNIPTVAKSECHLCACFGRSPKTMSSLTNPDSTSRQGILKPGMVKPSLRRSISGLSTTDTETVI